jgi:hypothetical protein
VFCGRASSPSQTILIKICESNFSGMFFFFFFF